MSIAVDLGRKANKQTNKQAELFQGNQSSFNNAEQFPLMSLSIRSTVKQKVDKIYSLLTCLCCVHFRGMTVVILQVILLDFYRLA